MAAAALAPGQFRNPVLAGFHPDPSICRVGDDYYIVNSSFAYFPGLPLYHSRDLVNWRQVGNAVDRPSQLNYDRLGVSRGIFAPSLSHHGDRFYLICTFVDAGGNFLMTARDPAGPWSDPVWLGFDGIDPSLFFDDDGRSWIVNNGPPPDDKPLYAGHRAIWMQEFDPVAMKLIGPREIKVNGGAALERHPVWIEGPHLFKKDGWYYLLCAEGGTAEDHSEVVFRSRSVRGPYVPGPANPVLTQRDLSPDRPNPVTCAGHADLVETPTGDWWAVFLGCRPYEDGLYNTGRETFMLPVAWKDGWPVILPAGKAVPYAVPAPAPLLAPAGNAEPLNGNFSWIERFDEAALAPSWLMLRRPHEEWFGLVKGDEPALVLTPRRDTLWGAGNPSFLGVRLQHADFDVTAELYPSVQKGVSAGLVAFQNETHHFYLGVGPAGPEPLSVFVERLNGKAPETLVRRTLPEALKVQLRMSGDGRFMKFQCRDPKDLNEDGSPRWTTLLSHADGTLLSTRQAGGFVGSIVGLHARLEDP